MTWKGYLPAKPSAGLILGMVVLSVLAGVAALGVIVGGRAILDLRVRLPGNATLVFRGAALESADAAAARAEEILRGIKGVTSVAVLDPAGDDATLANLIDGGRRGDSPTGPRLVSLKLSPGISLAAVAPTLAAQGLKPAFDRPGLWSSKLTRVLALSVVAAAAVLPGALFLSGLLLTAAIRRRLSSDLVITHMLILSGADLRFMAKEARCRLLSACGIAAASGAVLAAATILGLRSFTALPDSASRLLRVSSLDLAVVILWPLLIVLMIYAGSTAAARRAMRSAP